MRISLAAPLAAAVLVTAAPQPPSLGAQSPEVPADTAEAVRLEPVIVTAERGPAPLASAAAAVSRITAEDLERTPRATLADVLREIPGISIVDVQGEGYGPEIMIRGFYGGGEAEYVVLLLDGVPLNDVQGGRVPWDAVPLAAIERIEVIRGGASALYGDAAVGGVIHVITRTPGAAEDARGELSGGTFGSFRGSGWAPSRLLGRPLGVFGGFEHTDGFRGNAARTSVRAGARYRLAEGSRGSLGLSLLSSWREQEDPGPLPSGDLVEDRTRRDDFYRFDERSDRSHRVGLTADRELGPTLRLDGSFSAETRHRKIVRTIPLAPDFADTQERTLRTGHFLATLQLTFDGLALSDDRLTVGADASHGRLDSAYRPMVAGSRADYRDAPGEPGTVAARGEGQRTAGALFAQYLFPLTPATRLSLGVRADRLADAFEPRESEEDGRLRARNSAVSPKAGLNVRWLETDRQAGHLYLSAGRSFKAPTLDQLFDQRALPAPFPPFSIRISNALLVPQEGTSLEAGLYHRTSQLPGAASLEGSLSVYRTHMRNEVDFDLESFRYVNIGRSRHRGLEAALSAGFGDGTEIFANVTLREAVQVGGPFDGKQLKAIPRRMLSSGARGHLAGELGAGLTLNHVRDIYLDDANTIEHPAYTTADARLSYPVGGVRLVLDVRNVLNARYTTTGFPDPSGTGVLYLYPAAGRAFEVGIRR